MLRAGRAAASARLRRRMLGVAGLVIAGVVASAPPESARADAPAETVQRIHTRGRYPDDLLVSPPDDGTSHGGARAGRRPLPVFGGRGAPDLAPEPESPWNLPNFDFSFLGHLAWLGYVALGLSIAALVALLVWLLFRLRTLPADEPAAARAHAPEESDADLDPLLALPTLSHAELAAQGRFREAVHALLVEALLATGWVAEGRLRGLTAREIVHRYERPWPAREPLVELLRLVERVWFGGRDATRETYESALALHARFVLVPTSTRHAEASS